MDLVAGVSDANASKHEALWPMRVRVPLVAAWLVASALAIGAVVLSTGLAGAADTVNAIESGDHRYPSLQLTGAGNPVVSYQDRNGDALKLARCNDPACAGNDESIVSLDTGGGSHSSLVIDGAGFPVISYYSLPAGDLKLVRCDDVACTGGNESIVVVDSADNVGEYSSLELDAAGNPVIAYYDRTNGDLKLVHCNDAACVGGNESIVVVDSADNVGEYSSLELDAAGNPVIAYYDRTNDDLKLVHCDDPNCAGGNESIVAVDTAGIVGRHAVMELDGAGHPVIAYRGDVFGGGLKLARCNDPFCGGNNESIVVVDGAVDLWYPSLRLDPAGNPVISYNDLASPTTLVKIARCDDPLCAGGNDPAGVVVDSHPGGALGSFSSLALDALGHPVLASSAGTQSVRLVRCDDPLCDPPPMCNGLVVTVDLNATAPGSPTGGDDVVLGTPGNDVINGLGGNDTICAGAGNDTIYGSAGADTIFGEDGADTIFGGDGADTIDGGADTDIIQGNADPDIIDGGAGPDVLSGNDGADTINGGDGADEIYGGAGNDTINAGPGADTILGGTASDTIYGGTGNDLISGNAGNDIIIGDADNDTIYGVDGDDTITGGDGTDTILGGIGEDDIDGGNHDDQISGNEHADTINGGPGADTIYGVSGNDKLTGDTGPDTILGGDGDDQINGGDQNDLLSGNAGNDEIYGGNDDDEIYGANGNDTLTGNTGKDTILGGNNNDTINANDGEPDLVSGNNGIDLCLTDTNDTTFQCEN